MMQTSAATLHDLLGGALPRRIHLITGAPGSGKTSACLHFLRAGMVQGERTAMLTLDRPGDLRAHASHIGHDLQASVRDGRITLIRYHPRFMERVGAAASAADVIDELRAQFVMAELKTMALERPLRIVIDPVSPFLADGGSNPAALGALLDWIEEIEATALFTWNGDIAAADRRLESLVARAAVILRFHRLGGGRFRAEIVRARHALAESPPVDFEVRAGLGLTTLAAVRDDDVREQLLVS